MFVYRRENVRPGVPIETVQMGLKKEINILVQFFVTIYDIMHQILYLFI